MTDQAKDPQVQDLAAVREATGRLLTAVRKLDDAAVREPSRLPGWSRGHVLAHVARNADALVNVLTSARTGERIPMYVSTEAREADIERGAGRPLAAHLEDLAHSADGFNTAAAALHPEAWQRTVELRNGVTDRASNVLFRRLTEVELHHVDLGIGCAVENLPASFVDRHLDYVAGERFAGRPDVPALLVTTEDGRSWRTGRKDAEGGEVTAVGGTAAELLAWLTGRAGGAGLDRSAPALPALPPLG
ncbi:maleylpyruvate isomerase family mycothiol-dependent enzyme [Streptomyces pathocidini]|uniref:maleylpyruvate isomerase family mycothiol-dependent enzyme n=1 Tax=Streptomyces pathocidini TaxID=1650571 RepID=UPI0033ED1CBD